MERSSAWITHGFDGFSQGTCGNAGQNVYVSRAGVLQRIHQYDLNKDGYIELVFCNDHNHQETPPAYVYHDPLGRATRTELPTEGTKTGAVADLNGDDYDDLILGMWHNGARHDLNAVIYFGGPDGWSERRQQFLPAPTCTAAAAGDFDGDGKPELAFLCRPDLDWQRPGQLRLFTQTALGFEPKRFRDLPAIAGDQLAAGDLDGDGYAELVVRSRAGEVRVYWGGPEGIDPERCSVAPVALDEDHPVETDLAQPIEEWLGEMTPLAQIVQIAGRPHLFVARAASMALVPIMADRSFGAPLILEVAHAVAAAAGDIDGDGYTDLVVAGAPAGVSCEGCEPSQGSQQAWVYWGGAAGFESGRRTALPCHNVYDVAVGDLDGDGCSEVVLCQGHTGESYTVDSLIYRGTRQGILEAPARLVAHNPQRVFLARPAGEALPQVAFVNFRAGNVQGDIPSTIYFGGPDGFAPERRKDLPAWRGIEAVCADVNDDGYADVIFGNSYDGRPDEIGSFVYLNGPAGFGDAPAQRLPVNATNGFVCADINRDGYLDLIFGTIGSPDLTIFYGAAAGFDTAHPQTLRMELDGIVYGDPRWLYLADLNNDGWLDLVVPQISDERSLILWGGPDGFSMQRCQLLSAWHICSARAADLSSNGYLDLILGGHEPSRQGPHDSFVYIYWNGPAGLREDNRTLLPANAVNSMAIADFNNDGCLDLFITSYHDGRVRDIDSYIYWNRPGRGFAAADRQRLFTHSASGCIAADFNEDGWIDLAVANHKVWGEHVGDSFVWWNGPDGFVEGRVTRLPTAGPHGMCAVGPGNILDRGPEEYYTSAAFELPAGAAATRIGWKAELPPKTWVKAQLRWAATREGLNDATWLGPAGGGSWYSNGDSVALPSAGAWVQYRLALGAVNSGSTPRVVEVRVELSD